MFFFSIALAFFAAVQCEIVDLDPVFLSTDLPFCSLKCGHKSCCAYKGEEILEMLKTAYPVIDTDCGGRSCSTLPVEEVCNSQDIKGLSPNINVGALGAMIARPLPLSTDIDRRRSIKSHNFSSHAINFKTSLEYGFGSYGSLSLEFGVSPDQIEEVVIKSAWFDVPVNLGHAVVKRSGNMALRSQMPKDFKSDCCCDFGDWEYLSIPCGSTGIYEGRNLNKPFSGTFSYACTYDNGLMFDCRGIKTPLFQIIWPEFDKGDADSRDTLKLYVPHRNVGAEYKVIKGGNGQLEIKEIPLPSLANPTSCRSAESSC